MIGVVLPFLTEASPIERVRGVVTALASSPYDIALYDVESADRQQRAFRLLADAHRTDGLLVVSLIPPDEEVRRLRAGSIPCVLIDAHHDGLPSVVIDDVAGGELATRYLLELGHRRIAFIGDKPADPFRRQSSRDRTIGYERALAAAVDPGPARLRPRGDAEPPPRAQHRGGAAAARRSRRPPCSRRRTSRRSACSKPRAGSGSTCRSSCR